MDGVDGAGLLGVPRFVCLVRETLFEFGLRLFSFPIAR